MKSRFCLFVSHHQTITNWQFTVHTQTCGFTFSHSHVPAVATIQRNNNLRETFAWLAMKFDFYCLIWNAMEWISHYIYVLIVGNTWRCWLHAVFGCRNQSIRNVPHRNRITADKCVCVCESCEIKNWKFLWNIKRIALNIDFEQMPLMLCDVCLMKRKSSNSRRQRQRSNIYIFSFLSI